MKYKILVLSFLGVLFCSTSIYGQEFKSAIGLRLGYPTSVTYKTFITESAALEFFAGTRGQRNVVNGNGWRWWSLSGAYQIHKPVNLDGIEGLNYYYGFGATALFWNFDFETDDNTTVFGAQGYLGLSYTLRNQPINFSADWIPTFLIGGFSNGFGGGYGSFAVRYVLK